ncbi:hypothetical protein OUZ56_004460 [Daphnia magna]|uniref:Uncharacterized protein n=1 Tax=Daphnia magna TaxID=35525 RepID=A0ABQ9YPV6_9CRUS|nr:hypothetical protein OUZ56_004460 [Daphnia magna]
MVVVVGGKKDLDYNYTPEELEKLEKEEFPTLLSLSAKTERSYAEIYDKCCVTVLVDRLRFICGWENLMNIARVQSNERR